MIMGHLNSHYQLKMFLKFQKQEVSSLLFQVSILCVYMHAYNEFKVPISWLGILHNMYNTWNLVIRIALYLVLRKFYLHGLFDKNKQKFLNPWLVCILKHRGVTRQIPGLMSLPLNLTAERSTKIKFSNDKIYCNSYHMVPNIINM